MKFISINKELPQKNGIVIIKCKNYYGDVFESKALFDNGVFYQYGSPTTKVEEWAYRE